MTWGTLLSVFRHVKTESKPCHDHHGPSRKWMELTSNCARQLFPFVGLMAMVTTAFYANLRPFALAITIGFFQVTWDSANWLTPLLDSLWTTRGRSFDRSSAPEAAEPGHSAFQTSLSTTKHSTALRREPTEPSSPRHGGASHDALTDHRNLAQIKTREQWRADCPVQWYKRTTRLLQRVAVLVPRWWHPD